MGYRTLSRTTVCALLVLLGGCDALVSTEARLDRARTAIASGDSGTAGVELRKLIKQQPDHVEARLMLARLSMNLGDAAAARHEIDRAFPSGKVEGEPAAIAAEADLQLNKAAELLKSIDGGKVNPGDPARAIFRGRALQALRRSEEARAEFDRVLQTNPRNADALLGLAGNALAAGQSDEGLALVRRAIEASPQNAEARIQEAGIYLLRGEFRESEAAAQRTAKELQAGAMTAPQRGRLAFTKAEAQLALGEVDKAAATLEEIRAFAPQSLIALTLSARVALAKGDYASGIADLQRVVSAAPAFLQARMMLGSAHLAQGHLQQAERELAKVVEGAPDNIEARKLLGRVRIQLDRPDAALSALSPAAEDGSADVQFYKLLGFAHFRAGQSGAALEAFEQAVRANPGNGDLQLDLAGAYLEAGKPADAVTLLRRVSAKPGDPRREALLVAAINAQQGPIVARTELEKLIASQPERAELGYVAVEFYRAHREFDRARALLDRLAAANPKASMPLMTRARLELTAGDRAAAERAVREAAELDPKNPAIHLTLGQALLARNDLPAARSALQTAIGAAPQNAAIANAAGRLLMDAQRFDEALAYFRKAAELDAASAGYWLNASLAQLALNQPAPARESIDKALKIRPDWIEAESVKVMLDLRSSGPAVALSSARALRRKNPREAAPAVLEGDLHMQEKRYREAVLAYSDAERLKPEAPLAVKLHEAQRLAGQPSAEAPLQRWLERRPNDGRVRLVLASYYMGTDREKEAITEYEVLMREGGDSNAVVLNNLAWLYHTEGRDEAEATARKAYEIAPKNPAVADTYGWILLGKQKVDAALPLLKSAAQALQEPSVQFHYSVALAQAGHRDEARERLARLIEQRSEFAERGAAEKLLAELRG